MFLSGWDHTGLVPGSGVVFDMGFWYIPVAALFLVGWSNAVNITDGLDGLAGGTSAIAFGTYGLICGLSGQLDLALFCGAMVGALLAFLWFNVHPAQMFMGDVGSEALGAGLAAVAILSGHWILLLLVGLVFALEACSVVLQVSYFKYTRRKYGEGRRILRMAPLHHHYELKGWSEVQTTLRFWIVALVAGALGSRCGTVRTMISSQDLGGLTVAIVGAAREGAACARYLVRSGARVTLHDAKPQTALAKDLSQSSRHLACAWP